MVFITVGRRVECRWEQEEGTLNLHHDWDFYAGKVYMVQNYVATGATGIATPMTNWRAMGTNSLDLYVTREGDYPYSSDLTFNTHDRYNLHDEKTGILRIASPTVEAAAPETNPLVVVALAYPDGVTRYEMRLGNKYAGQPGFSVEATVRLPVVAGELEGGAGLAEFVQLVRCAYTYRTFDGRQINYSTGQEYLLDEMFPAMIPDELDEATPAQPSMQDSPSMPLPLGVVNFVKMDLFFKTYLIYKSDSPGSIWVTLRRMAWDVSGEASKATVDSSWTPEYDSNFGTYPVTFSRPLWEEDMMTLAGLPMVYFLEPKQHFGQKLLNMIVYFPGHDDVIGRNGYWIGEQGAGRIEGFAIDPISSDITLEYMAHIGSFGDTGWFQQSQFIGGRGEGTKAVEGFAIRLTGDARSKYNLSYCAYLHETGDTGFVQDGVFCCTRGQGRWVEAMQVVVTRKETV